MIRTKDKSADTLPVRGSACHTPRPSRARVTPGRLTPNPEAFRAEAQRPREKPGCGFSDDYLNRFMR